MMNKNTKHTGYTLIELLLYVGLVGMLLGAATMFFGVATEARIKNQTISEVNEQGAFVTDFIARTVRGASSISAPVAGSSGSQLTLVVPTAALSPTIFNVTGGVLQVKEGTAAAVALTNSKVQVTSFTVTNVTRSGTSGLIRVSITLARINNAARNEYDYTRTFTTSVGVRP